MATLGSIHDTLLGWAKTLDPKGRTAKVVELLSQTNEMLEDMLWIKANQITGHLTTIRTGLPAVYWAALNEGTPASTSNETQITEAIGRLKTWHEVDAELVDMSDTPEDFRMLKAFAHLEAVTQELCSTMIYGNATINTKEFNGFTMRYSDLSAGNASNIIPAGGVGADNTSIWLVVWHGATIAALFPRGSKAGVEHKNFGLQVSEHGGGTTGNLLEVYRDKWSVHPGLAVMDWRQAARICNIDVTNIQDDSSAADLRKFLTRLQHRVFSLKLGKPVIYMNRTVLEALDVQALNHVRSAGIISSSTVDGIIKRDFNGIPIKIVDAILNTEDLVT